MYYLTKLTTAAAFMLIAFYSIGQTQTLKGTVKDDCTGAGLPNIELKISPSWSAPNAYPVTDANGDWDYSYFSIPAGGTFTVEVNAVPGYPHPKGSTLIYTGVNPNNHFVNFWVDRYVITNFNINGYPVNNSNFTQLESCLSQVLLEDLSIGTEMNYEYQLIITEVDAIGNPIPGGGNDYPAAGTIPTWNAGKAGVIDLASLPGYSITGNPGYYEIKLENRNGCASSYQNIHSKTGLIEIPAFVGASITGFTVNGWSGSYPRTISRCASELYMTDIAVTGDAAGYEYKITITATDASGAALAPPNDYIYDNGWHSGNPPPNFDIENYDMSRLILFNKGYYLITLDVKNECNSVTYDDFFSRLIEIVDPLAAQAEFTINGQAVNSSTPMNLYTCAGANAKDVQDLSSGWQNYSRIRYFAASSTGLYNAGAPLYEPSYQTGAYGDFDLNTFHSGFFADGANTGYYRIEMQVQTGCNGSYTTETYPGLIHLISQDAAVPDFEINMTNPNGTNPPTVSLIPSQDINNPTSVCDISSSVSGMTTDPNAYINDYTISIDEYDEFENFVDNIGTMNESVSSHSPNDINGKNFNTVAIQGGNNHSSGYFTPTGLGFNKIYKVTFTVSNDCGSNSDWGYVKVDQQCKINKPGEKFLEIDRVELSPNPVGDVMNLQMDLTEEKLVHNISIIDVTGKEVSVLARNVNVSEASQSFRYSLNSLEPGIYFLRVSTESETYHIKFLKQ